MALDLLGYVVAVVLGIFPIADPFSTAPILIALTPTSSDQTRKRQAAVSEAATERA